MIRITAKLSTRYHPGLGEFEARSLPRSRLDPVFRSYARRLRPARPRAVSGKPLVFTTLFGDSAYEDCLDLTLTTLYRYGGYRGDILLLIDRPETMIRRRFARHCCGKLLIQPIDYADAETAMLQRFRLTEFGLDGYGPFLHLDSDILVLGPIAPILEATYGSSKFLIATEDRFCPQYRDIPAQALPEDGITDWYGVWLMKQRNSQIAHLRFANAGAFAFAGLALVHDLFADVFALGTAQRGTRFAHFGDQPILNILLHERHLGDFDVLDAALDYLRPIATPSRTRPFLHFNAIHGGPAKRAAMQGFLDACAIADA